MKQFYELAARKVEALDRYRPEAVYDWEDN
jgi:hypothetical protein